MAPVPPRPLSVLVVDGSPDGADGLAAVLRLYGHQVRVAYDPKAALSATAAEPPDAVLTDLRLPWMDGWELAGCSRRPLLVAVTGADPWADGRRVGFDHVFVKPADTGAVAAVLADHATRLTQV